MSEGKGLLILGAGGIGRVAKEVAEATGLYSKIDFLDDHPDKVTVVGMLSDAALYSGVYKHALVALGDNELRVKWLTHLKDCGFGIPALIHPRAYVSPSAKISRGSIILANAIVNTNSLVEEGCIIGPGAIIDHDVSLGYGSLINSGAVVKPNSRLEPLTRLGCGIVYP